MRLTGFQNNNIDGKAMATQFSYEDRNIYDVVYITTDLLRGKKEAGGYFYSNSNPYAIEELVTNRSDCHSSPLRIEYNSVNRVSSLSHGVKDTTYTFDYSSNVLDGVEYSKGALSKSDYCYLSRTSNKMLIKTSKCCSIIISLDEIIDAVGIDEGFGYNAGRAATSSVCGMIGGYYGMILGGKIGTAIYPGYGTVIGGIIGGVFFSDFIHRTVGNIYDSIYMEINGLNSVYNLSPIYYDEYNKHYNNFINGVY